MGLDPEGYGNPDYCWLSLYDTLIWSFAGPVAMAVSVSLPQRRADGESSSGLLWAVVESEHCVPQMNIFLYVLSSRASCSPRHHGLEKEPHV